MGRGSRLEKADNFRLSPAGDGCSFLSRARETNQRAHCGRAECRRTKVQKMQWSRRHEALPLLWRNCHTSDIRCGCRNIGLRLCAPLNRERSGGEVGVFRLKHGRLTPAKPSPAGKGDRLRWMRRNLLFLTRFSARSAQHERRRNPTSNAGCRGCNPLSSHSAARAFYLSVIVTFRTPCEIYHPPSADITAQRYHIPAPAGIYHCCQRLR